MSDERMTEEEVEEAEQIFAEMSYWMEVAKRLEAVGLNHHLALAFVMFIQDAIKNRGVDDHLVNKLVELVESAIAIDKEKEQS